ncbi:MULTISPECIES: peptide chain release factor N(5)-glutamine methyltransferase [unclassified Mycoplasma]|uniref:peptide chain release factor N(5)-glutamine methyltransferase n=1 Tax=unclassified Mycoplasma TaxID=2683645 RepID=UPI00211B969D|nr:MULTISPECIES: peptide chain release factor N(5)-glutamine methyltransferase [unclassified Mycoplasma]UUM19671.1 peptide chain release factor N(5)-glutamine methyltransferase [Mycoplasma sp. 1578d]UUM24639.1 peptide chain release factor N(5)-glutamine methyltransferase [Mycoplasma sp. 3686d]
MPSKADLLLEKRRYGLSLEISDQEQKMLNAGFPVQKIIGYVDLANVRINVSKNVLIPRYETEELVFHALDLIKKHNFQNVLDLCAGSGFIGIALKKNNANLSVTCADIDPQAIESTQENCELNQVNVKIITSDLFENINSKFDLIVSNPPYLSRSELISDSVLKFEPHQALFANENGLFFYKKILKQAFEYLNDKGMIIFEINPLHIDFWTQIKHEFDIEILKDLSGKNRFVIVKQKISSF